MAKEYSSKPPAGYGQLVYLLPLYKKLFYFRRRRI
jgi:hypothetical protein